VVPAREANPRVPAALAAVCRKAMARRPEDRYRTPLELAADVEHWLADEPVAVYREPLRARLGRWARWHRALVTGAAAAVLVALVALAAAAGLLAAANRRERQAAAAAEANYELAREAVKKFMHEIGEDERLRSPDLRDLRRQLLAEAGEFYERFVEQGSNDPKLASDLAQAKFALAYVAGEGDDTAETVKRYREAIDAFEKLVASEPGVTKHEDMLAKSLNNLGMVHVNLRQPAEGEELIRRGLEIHERLSRADPGNADYRRDRGIHHYNLGHRAREREEAVAAEREYRAALELCRKLVEEHPKSILYRRDLSHNHSALARLYRQRGRHTEAEKAWHGAQIALEPVADVWRGGPAVFRDLADCHRGLATSTPPSAGATGPRRLCEKQSRSGRSLWRPARSLRLPGPPGRQPQQPGPALSEPRRRGAGRAILPPGGRDGRQAGGGTPQRRVVSAEPCAPPEKPGPRSCGTGKIEAGQRAARAGHHEGEIA